MSSKTRIATELGRARLATEALLEPLSDNELRRQVSPLQSPLVWDYAHIAYFEELWLSRRVGGADPITSVHDDIYDAFQHARDERGDLPLLEPSAARAYAADVRARTLDVLERVDLDREDPLHRDGFVFGMVLQHELQHQETLLQTLQLRDEPYPIPGRSVTPNGASAVATGDLLVAAGVITLGTSEEPWAYDNERQAHELELPDFRIDRALVTNGRYLEFVLDGGYEKTSLWSEPGWAWRAAEDVTLPLGWQRSGDEIVRLRFGHTEALPPNEPVQHVSFYEADAFARWADKRLPTEQEWEKAARSIEGRRSGGGRVNFGPFTATVGSRFGGDVWEWTSSHFLPYPGFAAFPYAEYSEVFFGDSFRVLRGGSWATDPLVARTTFRNWDYPQRRQIFAGFRCACDA